MELSIPVSPPQICAGSQWLKFAERENHFVFVPKGDFLCNVMNLCFSELFVGDFYLAVKIRHCLGAKTTKQNKKTHLDHSVFFWRLQGKLIFCLLQKDMRPFFETLYQVCCLNGKSRDTMH